MMLLPIFALLAVTVTPARPAVGDLITVQFPEPVVLEQSQSYEVVSHRGDVVIVRTFEPKPFTIAGTMDGQPFDPVSVPVRSVLARGDDLKPAPLVPPQPVAYPREPFVYLAIAAAMAAVAWLFAWLRSRRKVIAPQIVLTPDAQFRHTVEQLLGRPSRAMRWATLADATRTYLAASRPYLGTDLTTTELLRRLREDDAIVREILQQGDLEKFSLTGAEPRNFDEIARRALELIPEPESAEQEAAA